MKTITEYQPSIFTRFLELSAHRTFTRQEFWRNVAAVLFYCGAGLWLCVDTGFAPWNWQFWTAFGPLFVAGEMAFREISTIRAFRPKPETT